MDNLVKIWEKNKKYYLVSEQICKNCDKVLDNIAVVSWFDNKHQVVTCVSCHKKNKLHYLKIKAIMIARIVEVRPFGTVLVIKPFQSLVNTNRDLNVDDDGVKIVDKTKFAGRESFVGSLIGCVTDPRAIEFDKQTNLLEEKKK